MERSLLALQLTPSATHPPPPQTNLEGVILIILLNLNHITRPLMGITNLLLGQNK